MTKLLEKAFNTAAKLPKSDQDAIAAMILEELASEERWAKTFMTSQEKLVILAKEALSQYRYGRGNRL